MLIISFYVPGIWYPVSGAARLLKGRTASLTAELSSLVPVRRLPQWPSDRLEVPSVALLFTCPSANSSTDAQKCPFVVIDKLVTHSCNTNSHAIDEPKFHL